MTRVGVVGATGKMGREVCRAVHEDPDLQLVAAVSRTAAGKPLDEVLGLQGSEVVAAGQIEALLEAGTDVAVDFTGPAFAAEHVEWCIAHGVHVVVGTTGFDVDPAWADPGPSGRPGGAELRRRRRAHDGLRRARDPPDARRRDHRAAPAHEARRAQRDRAGHRPSHRRRPPGEPGDVPIHSVRLPGLVAHQEVIFGAPGQTLSIRHDTTDRTAFMPGVLMAVKAVASRPGLTVGLEAIMELPS